MNRLFLIAGCLVLLLTGCQSTTDNPALQTLRAALWGADQPTGAGLDPRFTYLRVTVGKPVVFLALGYVDPHSNGQVEVWYSAKGEVIRLQNGRVVGAAGTLTEWRQVRVPVMPSWRELAKQSEAYSWQRERDVMPGYRFDVRDTLQLQRIAAPSRSAVVGIAPALLTWFEETSVSVPANQIATDTLRPARYAVEFSGDTERVVYGEQCLNAELCITWQRWVAGQ
jgi:hypothetical protein